MCDKREIAPSRYAELEGDDYFRALFAAENEIPEQQAQTIPEAAIALNAAAVAIGEGEQHTPTYRDRGARRFRHSLGQAVTLSDLVDSEPAADPIGEIKSSLSGFARYHYTRGLATISTELRSVSGQ